MQRTICSISYRPCEPAIRRYKVAGSKGGYLHRFTIPAAPRGGYELLVVKDMVEQFRYSSEAPLTEMPIYADGPGGLAEDLVQEWARNTVGDAYGGAGVFICTDYDVKDPATNELITPADKPSPREIEENTKKLTIRAQFLENQALDFWIQGKKDQIKEQHREAAAWLGHDKAEWMKPAEQVITVACPFCGAQIPGGRPVCLNCKQVINRRQFDALQKAAEQLEESQNALIAEAVAANPALKNASREELVGVGVAVNEPPKKPLPPPLAPVKR